MPVKPMHRHAAVVTAALFCCTGAAQGALIHETVSLSTGTVSAPGAGIGLYSFDLFDPALGELNFVQVDILGFLTLTLDIPLTIVGGVPLDHTVSSTLT
ncbi:MAG: hypothetical protein JXB36_15005, partial [Gammaproteobacteria bacterium]|nr:hypothetical protein [Gammaproteobacteria bacterium]